MKMMPHGLVDSKTRLAIAEEKVGCGGGVADGRAHGIASLWFRLHHVGLTS